MQKEIISYLVKHDPVMKQVTEDVVWPEIASTQNVFYDLIGCVIEQQIHYRSSRKVFAKLLAKASLKELSPDNFEVLEEKALNDLKLSMKKYETLAEVVDFFLGHSPDWANMSDKEVSKTLGAFPGVGQWTVDMILLYTLERPDIFPASDYHLRLVMQQLYGIGSKRITKEMKKIAGSWSPYQSYGTKYLLAWKQTHKQQKQ